MKNVFKTVIILGMLLTTSCATILNEKTQRVNITASSGEKVKGNIDGVEFEAPTILSVTRNKADKIIYTNDPKCNQTTLVPSQVDSKFWINILTGGLFGSTTDSVTEKMWRYDDNIVISCKSSK